MPKKFAPVNEQMDEIRRDALEIIPEDHLVKKLERSAKSGEPLRVKQGFDPTRFPPVKGAAAFRCGRLDRRCVRSRILRRR